MKVDVELMEAGNFFNKKSGIHPEAPILNVVWENNEGESYSIFVRIQDLFDPLPWRKTLPEPVRHLVVKKYGDELKQYYLEEKK